MRVIRILTLLIAVVFIAGCAKDSQRIESASSSQQPEVNTTIQREQQGSKKSNGPSQPQTNEPTKKQDADGSQKSPDLELEIHGQKVNLTWQDGGKPKMRVKADKLVGNTVAGSASLEKVDAELYEDGKLVARLSAPLIQADEKTRIVIATGGVTITSADPASSIKTIKAKWIKWYSRDNKIIGNGGITAVGPVASINAAEFIADTRMKTVRFNANPAEARAEVGER
ncbi:MAG TPA: LPS export ABC transporter periplasmic protein LptC [Armatimonadota bacterium]|nr:LPS export ABC transporter periplasmic protein LptC [Armatimonadota bacterium]